MIVDTSALIAILRGEEDAALFARCLEECRTPARLSAASYLALSIVLDAGGGDHSDMLDRFLEAAGIAIAPVTPYHARLAGAAYRRFGKGRGHPAGLNYGDCFSYALAKESGEALLFKGRDFALTDIRSATVSATEQ